MFATELSIEFTAQMPHLHGTPLFWAQRGIMSPDQFAFWISLAITAGPSTIATLKMSSPSDDSILRTYWTPESTWQEGSMPEGHEVTELQAHKMHVAVEVMQRSLSQIHGINAQSGESKSYEIEIATCQILCSLRRPCHTSADVLLNDTTASSRILYKISMSRHSSPGFLMSLDGDVAKA
jgi:hypothetical protein